MKQIEESLSLNFLLNFTCLDKKLLFLIFFISITCNSQNYYFENYQVEDGLSHNTITSSIQDHRGFLWFGTKDGLNRFDGYNFKVFRHKQSDKNSLGSNFIRALHEYHNNIWVGTDNGLYKYNEVLEDFDGIRITMDKPILDIENDEEGNLWFIAAGVLYRLDKQEKITSYNITYAQWLLKNTDGKIWMASSDRLFEYSKKTDTFHLRELDLGNPTEIDFTITKLYPLDSSKILIGTKYHGALNYNIIDNKISSILPESENPMFVRDFALKSNGELWIATESGLYIYDTKKNTFLNLKKSYNDKYALSDNALYCFTVDKEGGTWIGTYFGGINYYSKPYTPFNKYFPKVGENSISGNAVREIHKDRYGYLWIGTEDAGLNRFDPKTKKFINISTETLSFYNIHGILPINDELWVGTFEHGLDILDIKTGKKLRHYSADGEEGSLRSDFILDIFKSNNGKLYILTSLGVHLYDPDKNNFIVVKAFPENHHYSYIEEDKTGTLWAGTYWDGLFYYNPQTGKKGVFKHENGNDKSLRSNVINGIYNDSQNNLWITTENGLNLFDREKNNFKSITTNDGLPSNVVYSILEGDDHQLWISTSRGIVNFDPVTYDSKTYTVANGLLSDQFNYSSAYKADDGTMYFGSVYGMISFNPQKFTENHYSAPTLFTEMQINNKEVEVNAENSPLKKSINFLNKIELKHSQSSFSLEFANLTYAAPEMTKYWYRMEGLSDEWISLGKNHRVYFTELPGGTYNLQVKSKNSHEIWNQETSKMKIIVSPPFWLSKWAYLIYALIIVTLLFFLIRYYHNYNKNKNKQRFAALEIEKEKEIYQAKIQFFTNVAHEIRTPLTLIKAPLEKLLKMTNVPEGIQDNVKIMEKNTSRLLNLVSQLLDFRKTESRSLRLSFVEVNISRLLKDTLLRFKPAIEERNIDFRLNVSADPINAYVDEEAVKKIVSNLFNNAIKYCEEKVIVNLKTDLDDFKIEIQNDGKVIPSSLANKIFEPFFRINENAPFSGTGIGLSLAYSLAELHNGNLLLKTDTQNWNTFVLTLPLHQEKEFQLYHTEKEKIQQVGNDFSKKSTSDLEKANLLLVEDNEDLLEFLSKELQTDYKIFKASDGDSALKIIDKEIIHLVLSDVSMPGMNGFQLCLKIKTQLEYSHIPVVLLTAKNALDSRIEGLESGADTYVTKPFSMDFLKAQIHTLIQNRRHVMDYFASTPLSHIKSIAHTKVDKDFISKLDDIIYENLSDPNLSVEILADIMNMSRSTLYRKIKDLSNLTPNELINIARLKKAAELLNTGDYKIFEVADKVGYKSQTSLGRNFQKQFKMTPTEYMNSPKI